MSKPRLCLPIFFSIADEVLFNKFSENLLMELRPDNSVLDLQAQDVVACGWRVRMALRYEQQELQKQFAIERDGSPQAVGKSFLLAPNVRQHHQSMKLLDELKDRTQSLKSLPPEFEQRVTDAFGAGFWRTLQDWNHVDPVKMWVLAMLEIAEKKAEIYGTQSPLGAEWASRLDLAIRYLTTARRDFYRALREYREAKTSS